MLLGFFTKFSVTVVTKRIRRKIMVRIFYAHCNATVMQHISKKCVELTVYEELYS
jgi:hypothetical protein